MMPVAIGTVLRDPNLSPVDQVKEIAKMIVESQEQTSAAYFIPVEDKLLVIETRFGGDESRVAACQAALIGITKVFVKKLRPSEVIFVSEVWASEREDVPPMEDENRKDRLMIIVETAGKPSAGFFAEIAVDRKVGPFVAAKVAGRFAQMFSNPS